MDYKNMKVVDLEALTKECGLRGYSKLKKAKLITFLQNNLQPTQASPTRPPRPTPALHTRPPRPTRPPPPPPQMSTWDRPRPTLPFVRPRQPSD